MNKAAADKTGWYWMMLDDATEQGVCEEMNEGIGRRVLGLCMISVQLILE